MGELVTGQVATEFLEVYSRIRDHDPALYKSETQFFKEQGELAPEVLEAKEQAKAARPEKRGRPLDVIHAEEEEDEDLEAVRRGEQQMTYVEEQQALKREFKEALLADEENAGEDDLLVAKTRSADEQVRETEAIHAQKYCYFSNFESKARFEEEYKRFLDKTKREKLQAADAKTRAYWVDEGGAKMTEQVSSKRTPIVLNSKY